ncbi:MAG TPA: SDR family NAD(P)-dependent oxidoreductase [Rhodospirillaceae bacterium]|nr:SDR family NAD(P)-dependent oxidoreductase [Rhodospirillaceae bacterium]
MRCILITGASSGLGEALARAYAGTGVRLCLGGRDAARLEAVGQACRDLGAAVDCRCIDVADRQAMAQWLNDIDERHPLDLVIANAGVSAGTGADLGETAEQARAIFSVNLEGVLNTVLPVIEPMRRRRRGQIVIMASLAGFRGLPSAPAYSASKAAVRVWGEGLRGWLASDGIGVTVVCPGFVATPMTSRNRFPMPFLMTADDAARLIRRAVGQNRGRVAFPWPMAALLWLLAALPPGWTDGLLGRLPKKS